MWPDPITTLSTFSFPSGHATGIAAAAGVAAPRIGRAQGQKTLRFIPQSDLSVLDSIWTQGYVTNWRPGDVEAVGPLHGTHEPPFYVCGSDQWVAGYMEGAVRTGRGAARAALRDGCCATSSGTRRGRRS